MVSRLGACASSTVIPFDSMVYGNNQKRANDLNREKWFFQNLAFCLENATIEAVFLMCAFSFLLTFFVYD